MLTDSLGQGTEWLQSAAQRPATPPMKLIVSAELIRAGIKWLAASRVRSSPAKFSVLRTRELVVVAGVRHSDSRRCHFERRVLTRLVGERLRVFFSDLTGEPLQYLIHSHL
jgi:hypothetical protein